MVTSARPRLLALLIVLLCRLAACGGNASAPKPPSASAGTAGQAFVEPGSAGAEQNDADASPSSLGAGGIPNDDGSGPLHGGSGSASVGESGAKSEAGGRSDAHAGCGGSGGACALSSAGTGGVAGSGGAAVTVHLSGTHDCTDPRECFSGLTCRGRAGHELTLCLAPCESDADCLPMERCIQPSDPLGPDVAGCFLRCDDSPLDCPLLFNCEDPSGQGTYTCLPRLW